MKPQGKTIYDLEREDREISEHMEMMEKKFKSKQKKIEMKQNLIKGEYKR